MTFLELCQDVGLLSGLVSTQNQMGTTVGQVGRQLKIVTFTAQAWRRLQLARTDWEFMRGSFSHALVIGQNNYTPLELGIATRFGRFACDVPASGYRPMRLYDAAIGVSDSQNLVQISPECWSMIYGRGEQTNLRSTEYALAAGKLYIGSAPDKAYTLAGDYWKAPQTLAADDDEPELPEQFHDTIKWLAIRMMSGMEGAFADRTVANAEYASLFRQLVNDQTRPVDLGGPFA